MALSDLDGEYDLTPKIITGYLKKIEKQDLLSHYKFKGDIKCNITDGTKMSDFIKSNRPLEMEIKDGGLYYKTDSDEEKDELFTIDTESSFSGSNVWFYSRIINVENVYPNISEAKISSEMTAFFICLVISSALGGEFEIEFLETCNSYNFKTWTQPIKEELNFMELSREWIQMGSETVKMMAAAAKFAISRDSKKNDLKSQLDLDSGLASEYKELVRKINNFRYDHETNVLSAENVAKMTRLDIKVKIRERDIAIQSLITSNTNVYKLWRLLHLNSDVIDPSIKRKFIRLSKKECQTVFFDIIGRKPDFEDNSDLFKLKRVQDKLKKEAIRACLNKIFSIELLKYKSDPENYIPPNFV
jgi:hypothetical protein